MTTHRSVDYRRKALPLSFVRKVLRREQHKIYERFIDICRPGPDARLLDLGVSASLENRDHYFFEVSWPHPASLTAAGLEAGNEAFQSLFPEIAYVQVRREEPLPFADRSFDLVFCSAVIEHVGDRDAQRAFLDEIMRVGRRAFLTTPNRWFPVELHTMLPLIHYLPAPAYRRIYRTLGFDFFSREENMNLLDERELRALLRPQWNARIERHWFAGFPSNLLVLLEHA